MTKKETISILISWQLMIMGIYASAAHIGVIERYESSLIILPVLALSIFMADKGNIDIYTCIFISAVIDIIDECTFIFAAYIAPRVDIVVYNIGTIVFAVIGAVMILSLRDLFIKLL